MIMEDRPYEIIVIDDMDYGRMLAAFMRRRGFIVFEAVSSTIAENEVLRREKEGQKNFDAAIIDINLGENSRSGKGVAGLFKQLVPEMPIIMLSGDAKQLEVLPVKVEARMCKVDCMKEPDGVLETIVNVTRSVISQKGMSKTDRIKRFEILSPVMCGWSETKSETRSGDDNGNDITETFDGRWTLDDHPFKFVVYCQPKVNKKKIVISVTTTDNCDMECLFCLHGLLWKKHNTRKNLRPLILRPLSVEEIVAQPLYALLNSNLLQPFFYGNPDGLELYINPACQGDPSNNLDNFCLAMREIKKISGLSINLIMTSTGNVESLQQLIEKYPDLDFVHYVSGNSFLEKWRRIFMRKASMQNIYRVLDFHERIFKITGNRPTFSKVVMQGSNDTNDDLKTELRYFLEHPCWDLKFMPLRGGIFPNLEPTLDYVKEYASNFSDYGIPTRVRDISAVLIGGGCGNSQSIFPLNQ